MLPPEKQLILTPSSVCSPACGLRATAPFPCVCTHPSFQAPSSELHLQQLSWLRIPGCKFRHSFSFVALQVKTPSDTSQRSAQAPQWNFQHSQTRVILTSDFINPWGTREAGNAFPGAPSEIPPPQGRAPRSLQYQGTHLCSPDALLAFQHITKISRKFLPQTPGFPGCLLVWPIFAQILSNCHKAYVFI